MIHYYINFQTSLSLGRGLTWALLDVQFSYVSICIKEYLLNWIRYSRLLLRWKKARGLQIVAAH